MHGYIMHVLSHNSQPPNFQIIYFSFSMYEVSNGSHSRCSMQRWIRRKVKPKTETVFASTLYHPIIKHTHTHTHRDPFHPIVDIFSTNLKINKGGSTNTTVCITNICKKKKKLQITGKKN